MFVIDNIAKVGKLELLKDILRDSIITKQVLEEFNLGIERGILALCVKTDVLTLKEADQILRAMIKSGFYSPIESLEEVLKE